MSTAEPAPDGGAEMDPWARYVDTALAYLAAPDTAGSQFADARRRFVAFVHEDAGSGFGALVANAWLSEPECELLALALGCELDAERQRLLSYLQGDAAQARLTLQTAGRLLGGLERCAAAIGPSSRLRRAALLEVSGDGPWAQQSVVPPDSLVWAVLGDASPDPDLPHGTQTLDVEPLDAADALHPLLVIAYGTDKVRRREAAVRALTGERFLVAPAPVDERGWAAIAREATVTGRAAVVELEGELSAEGRRWIEFADHLSWAVTAASELPIDDLPDRPFVEVDAPAAELTEAEWATALGSAAARTHRLMPQQLERVRKIYRARGGDIDASVRRLLAGRLEALAHRVRPQHSWDDLVLPPNRLAQLRGIAARYRDAAQVYDRWGFAATPSRGLVALFTGPSGTGKTLSAEVVAGDLGLDMFRVDLSTVVSKYIGDTEKNLDEVFDAAGVGNVVLFFDEADALFGRRSEVKDAHDRYANVGVSYLLQRLETFDGIVVLATNFEKSIDDAFLRRIHCRVDFAAPDVPERLAIWRRHLRPDAVADDVDLEFLAANLAFTGGQIRNAAVNAAFLAAGVGTLIGMAELVRATAQELRKAGRLVPPETFGPWYDSITD